MFGTWSSALYIEESVFASSTFRENETLVNFVPTFFTSCVKLAPFGITSLTATTQFDSNSSPCDEPRSEATS